MPKAAVPIVTEAPVALAMGVPLRYHCHESGVTEALAVTVIVEPSISVLVFPDNEMVMGGFVVELSVTFTPPVTRARSVVAKVQLPVVI